MSQTGVKSLHVLVLGDLQIGEELGEWVDAHARVDRIRTLDAALQALRTEPYDLVIAGAADFIPFKDLHFSQQAGAILDTINHGVCIVGEGGALVWANPRMLAFEDEVKEHVCKCCLETFQWARAQVQSQASPVRARRFNFTTQEKRIFELTATPVIDLDKRIIQVAAVVWDVTGAKRLQSKIDAIDEAGRELVRLDTDQFARLDTQDRLALLEQKILHCTRDVLHFDNFAVFLLQEGTNKLQMILSSGLPVERQHLELFVSSEGNGITGYVAARGRSYICPDVTRDSRYIAGIEGARSSLVVPLRLHDRIIGVANFESTRLNAFTEDDRQFAEIFGRYVAIALHVLELLVTERRATTGRLGTNVMAEITAPLNDILTDVESLVEDYIGHDDLRHRLRAISENAVRIRETIKSLTNPKAGVVGFRVPGVARRDPDLADKRILVADDEDVIRDTVRDVLLAHGCKVTAVCDGCSAAEIIATEPFDLVLSDIKMPGKSGYEVYAAAKQANPATPVILMTGFGYDPNHSIVRARREGLSAVLFKPFKVDQLLGEVRVALKSVAP